ncbi:hypothetical protein [Halosimplex salinum]|uniref:hypothetical protein n=1 Tax=Halosimplex salinum TaxID=1710538 RepID=UPI0013DDAA9A|nr:hypothetical protein [Halosimplex salinum]
MTEQCGICGERVPFDATVHLLVNPQDEEGIRDRFVCQSCHEAEITPLFQRR